MSKNPIKEKVKQVAAARQIHNTLRQLTIQKAVTMLDEAESGIYTRLAWTSRKIEKRWSVMIGLKRNREGALLEMDWDVRTTPEDDLPPGATIQMAEAQANAIRATYEKIQNLREAIKFLHLASFRGFSHLEKINEAGLAISGVDGLRRLEPVNQWHMIRDGLNGEWKFDDQLRGSLAAAIDIEPSTLIAREVDDPICEVALIAYIYEMNARKDWAGFGEIFGIPDIFFTMPQGADEKDIDEWMSVLTQAIGDGKGLLPYGSDVKTVGGDVRGSNPFEGFVKFQREDVVLAGTGGKLTMMAESGSGTLAGGAQADVFERIAQAEARDITEIFNAAIDRPLLEEMFPGQPVLAQFVIAAEDEEDTKAFAETVSKLASAGYYVDPDQVQERTGLRVEFHGTAQPSEPISNRQDFKGWKPRDQKSGWLSNAWNFIANRKSKDDDKLGSLQAAGREGMGIAVEQDVIEAYDRLAEILDADLTYDELLEQLEEFQTSELPELTRKAIADPSAADAIADTISAAVISGIADQVERQKVEG